jgi:hypothetical protein
MHASFSRFILIATLLAGATGWRAGAQVPPSAGGGVPNPPAATRGGPQIQFAETTHDFGRLEHGSTVKFDFEFTNTGTARLEVLDVRSSCGCATAGAWSRKVEPGQRGVIPIQFTSSALAGPVHKTVIVTSNTPRQPQTILNLKATVWRAIDVTPATAYFTPPAGAQEVATRVVRIVNNTPEPLELAAPECASATFTAVLTTLQPGREFEVRVTAKPPFRPGIDQAAITLKTSSKSQPLITIPGIVMVPLPITAVPAQITLGPAPLVAASKLGVTIRNGSGSAITLSEATVSVPGVTATVTELQPGRVFNVTLDFPKGFALTATEGAELRVKTSHPQFPLVRVPIAHVLQVPPPTVAPAVRPPG